MPKSSMGKQGPKKIVYLWGAGATQAEITYRGAYPVNLLMRDSEVLGEGMANRIIKGLPPRWQATFASDSGTDIEKLISLCSACNVKSYHQVSDSLRKLYFADIRDNLTKANVLDEPQLAIALLEMHAIDDFSSHESLIGFITTNHDGLLQSAAQRVHGGVELVT